MTNETAWKPVIISSAILALIYFGLSLMTVMIGADLNLYLRAASTLLLNYNPYSIEVINKVTSGPPIIENMPYVYSPASFLFFIPFLSLSREAAQHLFNLLMAISFGFSAALSLRYFKFESIFDYLFYLLVALLGFGFPIFYTIIFQNPAPLECLSILIGTHLLIQQRVIWGSLLFIPSIVIKLQPLLLLVMLLLTLERVTVKSMIAAFLPVSLGIAIPAILRPDMTINWIVGLRVRSWMDDPGDFSIIRFL